MAHKIIHAMYDDDHTMLDAAKDLVGRGMRIKDVYSPFPVHGIDPVIGLKRTRMGIVSFMFGALGMSLALLGMWYFMIEDWPMNVGGKPSFSLIENLPSFIPITFEFTVLCAAHGMAITYFLRNSTLPGMPAFNPDPRTTDDKFVLEIAMADNAHFSDEEIDTWLRGSGAIEINEKEIVR